MSCSLVVHGSLSDQIVRLVDRVGLPRGFLAHVEALHQHPALLDQVQVRKGISGPKFRFKVLLMVVCHFPSP